MTGGVSAGNEQIVSRVTFGEKFGRALRLYVGTGKRYTVKELARGTGLDARQIETWLCSVDSADWREPKGSAVLCCASFLGAEFTTDWLALAGQGAFDITDGDPGCIRQIGADAVDDAAVINRATMDGVLEPHERQPVKQAALRQIANGGRILKRVA